MENYKNNRWILKIFPGLKEDGQIFPFLIIVVILMLVALMAFINLSEFNLRKLSTMNAADSGALAGAAQLASIANLIADKNKEQRSRYNLNWKNAFFRYTEPLIIGFVQYRYGVFQREAVANLRNYLSLIYSGFVGTQQAGASAVQMAYANMPIEETQRREGGYEGEIQKSNFSSYLEDLDIYKKEIVFEPPAYEWYQHGYNLTLGRQEKNLEPERVKVKVRKPDQNAFSIIPVPIMPDATLFWLVFPPPCPPIDVCTPICQALKWQAEYAINDYWPTCGMYCSAEAVAYAVIAEYTTASIVSLIDRDMLGPEVAALVADVEIWVAGLMFELHPIKLVDNRGCPGVIMYLVIWPLPFPFYASIGDVDFYQVEVEVTRFSPARDLGLFQFRGQEVTSGARAGIAEGSISKPGSYKAKVHEVWDGKRI